MPFTMPIHYLEFATFVIFTYCPCVEWVGSFVKNFQKGGEGSHQNQVSLVLYVVFVATELHPDTIFFQHFLA